LLSDCRISTALPVSDLARARSFYVDTLGLTPVAEAEDVPAFFCQALDAEVADLQGASVNSRSLTCRRPRSRTASTT